MPLTMLERVDVPVPVKTLTGMIFAVGATRWISPATMVPWPNAEGSLDRFWIQDGVGGLVQDGSRRLIQDERRLLVQNRSPVDWSRMESVD